MHISKINNKIIFRLILLTSILLFSFGFFSCEGNFYQNGIKVKGKVTGISKKAIYRSAIVRFKTKKNQIINFQSKLDVSVDLFDYKIGQTVNVIYNQDDPFGTASIDTKLERNATKIMY